jgi:hypothetical protein
MHKASIHVRKYIIAHKIKKIININTFYTTQVFDRVLILNPFLVRNFASIFY